MLSVIVSSLFLLSGLKEEVRVTEVAMGHPLSDISVVVAANCTQK